MSSLKPHQSSCFILERICLSVEKKVLNVDKVRHAMVFFLQYLQSSINIPAFFSIKIALIRTALLSEISPLCSKSFGGVLVEEKGF